MTIKNIENTWLDNGQSNFKIILNGLIYDIYDIYESIQTNPYTVIVLDKNQYLGLYSESHNIFNNSFIGYMHNIFEKDISFILNDIHYYYEPELFTVFNKNLIYLQKSLDQNQDNYRASLIIDLEKDFNNFPAHVKIDGDKKISILDTGSLNDIHALNYIFKTRNFSL